MLVTFSCPGYTNITLFGEVAVRLLGFMGHSGTVPGALTAEDIPAALARLEAAVAPVPHESAPAQTAQADDEDDEPAVSLLHRALPLIELLKVAAKEKVTVMWEGNGST